MAEVSLRKLNKRFDGGVHAVKDVDLHIRDREFVVFVGPPVAARPRPCA